MRRTTLFLLTIHLAACPLFAQTPLPAQMGGLEVRIGDRVTTYPAGKPLPDARPTTPPVNESLVNFDPQHVEVVWAQNHWQLVADGNLLKDFGRREVEARLAVRLVRDLHLTQHGVVGTPQPIMEYWLSNGRAPHGMTMGLHITPLDTPDLRIEQLHGQWTVRDNNRVLFNFAAHESDARTALAILQKYGFTQIGVLGGAGTTMMVMLGHVEAQGGESDANLPHLVRQSPLHEGPKDANAPKKAVLSDTNPVVTPVIAPLRSPTDSSKQTLTPSGRTETVEVLSANDPARPKHAAQPLSLALDLIDRTPIDWRQFQIRQDGGLYLLAAGNLVLARFTSDHDARLALSTVQHYRFTEVDHIGRPQPYCSYFLCTGQGPRGQIFGPHTEPFQADKLTVVQVENRWAIVTPEKPLLWFGGRPEEARVMLDVIQRQQFDRLCHIGDERGMTFFVRSR